MSTLQDLSWAAGLRAENAVALRPDLPLLPMGVTDMSYYQQSAYLDQLHTLTAVVCELPSGEFASASPSWSCGAP